MQATSSRTAPARRALAVLSRHRQKAASVRCRPRRDGADKKQGRRHGFSTVRARAFPRNRGGSARASGESTSAKPRRSARAQEKTPPPLRRGLSSRNARLAPLAFLRAAAPAQSPVGRPRSFKPRRPGPPRGRAAWRCDRSTAGSQAPPRRPGRSPARRSTAPPGGSTRGSRA